MANNGFQINGWNCYRAKLSKIFNGNMVINGFQTDYLNHGSY
jgi:hypothetical protein